MLSLNSIKRQKLYTLNLFCIFILLEYELLLRSILIDGKISNEMKISADFTKLYRKQDHLNYVIVSFKTKQIYNKSARLLFF